MSLEEALEAVMDAAVADARCERPPVPVIVDLEEGPGGATRSPAMRLQAALMQTPKTKLMTMTAF